MLQIDWAAREAAGNLSRHHHLPVPCRHAEWFDDVMIFLPCFDPPRFDGRHACDGLALVAHDGTSSEAPVNCRWVMGVLGREIEIDRRGQTDAHGVSSSPR